MSTDGVKTVSLKTSPAKTAIRTVAAAASVTLTASGSSIWNADADVGSVLHTFTLTVSGKGAGS